MYVVTFYSFKGGVGRTLALLNVAYEMANAGQRVLVVDFDLEAPAIRPDQWTQGTNDEETDGVGQGPTDPGVVEFVTRYLDSLRVPPVSDYIVDATPEGCRGSLAVMSAGAVDGTYGQRLNAIDWGLLYAERDGYVMFEDVRAQWEAAGFDYVLLDSRTGFTDVGGICTRHLPDAVVSLFRPDDQGLEGTVQMAEAIRAEVPTPRRAYDIEQHFVMAGIPDADDEHGHLARRRQVFVDRLDIPGHDLLTEIRHYSSMDLLTQPIYTMQRRGTRLAKSYLALTGRIRARNLGDREGVLEGLRDAQLRRNVDHFIAIVVRFPDDFEVLATAAEASERVGEQIVAGFLLGKASRIGQLTPAQLHSLARGRVLDGDEEGASQALISLLDGSADPSGAMPRQLLLAALDLLRLLVGERVGGMVAHSPVIAGAPPPTRAAVALHLDRSVRERQAAVAILEELIAADDTAATDDLKWNLAFARMAVGDCDRAAAFFKDTLMAIGDTMMARGASDPKFTKAAFNLAMAVWGKKGVPSGRIFRLFRSREPELILPIGGIDEPWLPGDDPDEDVDEPWVPGPGTAGFHQAVALALWFGGHPDDARGRLAQAEEAADRNRFSCWSYTRVPRKTFLAHCAEIRRLFDGEDIAPVFVRTHNASGEPSDGPGEDT